MKRLLVIILLLFTATMFAQEMVVLHVNAKWNSHNDYTDVKKLKNVTIQYANLEDQSLKFQKSVKGVPAIVLYKDGNPITSWQAGISLRLNIKHEEIQAVIDLHKPN